MNEMKKFLYKHTMIGKSTMLTPSEREIISCEIS